MKLVKVIVQDQRLKKDIFFTEYKTKQLALKYIKENGFVYWKEEKPLRVEKSLEQYINQVSKNSKPLKTKYYRKKDEKRYILILQY